MANHAAAFVLDNAAAVRAGAFEKDTLDMLNLAPIGRNMSLNRLGYSVSTRQNFVFAKAGRRMAGNPLKLLDDLARLNSVSPSQRNQPPNSLIL